jgi:uncharacterized phage protein gp47/JayE
LATLPTKSFTALVQTIAAGVQGRAAALIDFSIGSTLRAIAESFSAVCLWLQAMVLQVLAASRLSTSTGSDVDSFIADFGIITRIGGISATGLVAFARFTAGPSAPFIPVGSQVTTGDRSVYFQVYADPTNANYSAVLNGYTLPSSVASINVPVSALTPGAVGNVQAGQINTISSTLTGIDTVNNVAAFANGSDSERDDSFKARFQLAILGLSAGDLYGTQAAIGAVSTAVQYTITEFYNYDGSYRPAFYYIVADDGSGAPSAPFLTAVASAADSVRPLGNSLAVFGPILTTAAVSMTLTTATGYTHATVVAQVAAAIANAINRLGLGIGLPYTYLSAVAYGVPGVTNVASVLLNAGTADIAASKKATIKAGTLTIS